MLSTQAARLMAAAGLLILAGCGGGGGGGSVAMPTAPVTPVTPPTVAAVTLGPATAIQSPAVPLLAAGTTPSFSSALPQNIVFPLTESVLAFTNTSVTDYTAGAGATLTLVGVKLADGTFSPTGTGLAVYRLSVPGLISGSDAQLASDGTKVTLAGGGQVASAVSALNYMHFGIWFYQPSGGLAYQGVHVSGFQTPTSGVPASGNAIYAANQTASTGAVSGLVFIPDGSGSVNVAGLSGQASITVNFTNASLSGSLTAMSATPSSSSGGTTTPWNTVSLSGSLSGATFAGTTTAGAAPAGASSYAMSGAATGKFSGALYGPNGQELGAVWTLNEPNPVNGKTAVGTIAATKQ